MAITSDGTPTYFTLTQELYNEALAEVQAAQLAWTTLITEFAAENIAMGIIQEQKIVLIGTTLEQVNLYGSQGALAQAYTQLNEVVPTPEMAPYLTNDRIKWMCNKIIQVLGTL
jgi:hypothetical protein